MRLAKSDVAGDQLGGLDHYEHQVAISFGLRVLVRVLGVLDGGVVQVESSWSLISRGSSDSCSPT